MSSRLPMTLSIAPNLNILREELAMNGKALKNGQEVFTLSSDGFSDTDV